MSAAAEIQVIAPGITGDPQKYDKIKGFATTEGQNFEKKVSALVFLRCMNSGRDFQLGSNVKGAGALDDVVLRFLAPDNVWHTVFVQLKHKISSQIRREMFLGLRGDFVLLKYLPSYIDIKSSVSMDNDQSLFRVGFDSCHFAIFTNASVSSIKRSVETCYLPSPVDEYIDMRYQIGPEGEYKTLSSPESNFTEDYYKSIHSDMMKEEELRPANQRHSQKYSVISNEEDARSFLKRFKLFYGQPREDQLDKVIEEELKKFGVDDEIESVRRIFLERIGNWWQQSEGFLLNQNSTLLLEAQAEAMLPHVNLLTQQYAEKFLFDEVQFLESSTDDLKIALAEHSLVSVVAKESVRFTASKVRQALKTRENSYIFLDAECLAKERKAVMSAWRHGDTHLLVIVSQTGHVMDTDICTEISQVLQEKKNKRMLLVSSSNDSFVSHLEAKMGTDFETFLDPFHLSHLDEDTIKTIFNKHVVFQGHSTTVGALFGDNLDVLSNVLKSSNAFETIFSKGPIIIGRDLKVNSIYLDRTMECMKTVQNAIFSDNHFLGKIIISGAALKDAPTFLPTSIQTLKYFKESSEGLEFNAYECNKDKQLNVEVPYESQNDTHYLDFIDSMLVWKKTEGDISCIKKYIDESVTNAFNESVTNAFNESHERVNLLVAEPGMGKSTIFTHWAQRSKEDHPDSWIVSISLSEHSSLMEQTKIEDMTAEKFLASALGLEKMGRLDQELFKYSMNHSGNMYVYLDGVDEISQPSVEKFCALVSSLEKTKVKGIWVSSRHSMHDILEQSLSTLAVNLQKFSEMDQRRFLEKYWETSSKLSQEDLEEFITKLLHITATSVKDKEREFTGIPLQTRMLAEVFQEYVEGKSTSQLPEHLDTLQLIEQFVDKKLKVYVKREYDVKDMKVDKLANELRNGFEKNHIRAALILLLDDSILEKIRTKRFNREVDHFLDSIEQGLDGTGIVDKIVDKKPTFLHRVFAEYFVALWFAEHFEENRDIMEKCLFAPTCSVVRSMFDRILSRDLKLHNAVLSYDIKEVVSLLEAGVDVNSRDRGGRTALHLAAVSSATYNNHLEGEIIMIDVLMKYKANVSIKEEVLQWTPMQYADASFSLNTMNELLKHGPVNYNQFKVTILNINVDYLWFSTIHNDYLKVLILLLDLRKLNCETDVKCSSQSNVNNDHANDVSIVDILNSAIRFGSLEICRTLLSRASSEKTTCNDIVNADVSSKNNKLSDEQNALWKLLLAEDRNHRNALMTAAMFGQAEAVTLILNSFTDENDRIRFISRRDNSGSTALHTAVFCDSLSPINLLPYSRADPSSQVHDRTTAPSLAKKDSVISRILASFTDDNERKRFVNIRDNNDRSALSKASFNTTIEILVKAGTEVTVYDSCMYWMAINTSINEIGEAILASFNNDDDRYKFLNMRQEWDIDKSTALFRACLSGNIEYVECLLSYGADVFVPTCRGSTTLMAASSIGYKPIVDKLLASFTKEVERKRFVNLRNDMGNTAYSFAFQNGHIDIVEVLLSFSADVVNFVTDSD